MTVDVKVPVLAESIPDATLLEWRKRPGDRVEQDEILIELETDKVVLEVPAPAAGILAEVLKQTGDMVLSQEVLARIDSGESAFAAAPGAGAGIVSGIAAGSAPAAAAASGGRGACLCRGRRAGLRESCLRFHRDIGGRSSCLDICRRCRLRGSCFRFPGRAGDRAFCPSPIRYARVRGFRFYSCCRAGLRGRRRGRPGAPESRGAPARR